LVAATSAIQRMATGGEPPVTDVVQYTLFFKKRL
jgi:hypothetical protein